MSSDVSSWCLSIPYLPVYRCVNALAVILQQDVKLSNQKISCLTLKGQCHDLLLFTLQNTLYSSLVKAHFCKLFSFHKVAKFEIRVSVHSLKRLCTWTLISEITFACSSLEALLRI